MREPTYKEYQKLLEIDEEIRAGRQGNEDDMDTLWEMVRGDQLRNLASLGVYDWIFILTDDAKQYLESV